MMTNRKLFHEFRPRSNIIIGNLFLRFRLVSCLEMFPIMQLSFPLPHPFIWHFTHKLYYIYWTAFIDLCLIRQIVANQTNKNRLKRIRKNSLHNRITSGHTVTNQIKSICVIDVVREHVYYQFLHINYECMRRVDRCNLGKSIGMAIACANNSKYIMRICIGWNRWNQLETV